MSNEQTKIFRSPSKYIQGTDILKDLPDYISDLGKKLLLLVDPGIADILSPQLDALKAREDYSTEVVIFSGECTMPEIDRVGAVCKEKGIDVIAGVGGGKVIDTAKAVSHFNDLAIITVPTIAASDAPCSALSIIYHDDGSLDQLLWLKANPDLVLVDLQVVANAPARFLAAGIGDAMATYFEMKECYAKDADNFTGGRITLAAKAIAEQCYKTIIEKGYNAYLANKNHVITRDFEDVVEANIILSGIGFESGGICAAHPINNGVNELPQTHKHMHGEKVAFSLIGQFVLAQEPKETVDAVLELFYKVGLPITLEDLDIVDIKKEELDLIATIANGDPCTHNLPLRVDEGRIIGAVITADAMGREFKEKMSKCNC